MSDTKEFTLFNGNEWMKITSEQIYKNGKPTGHYKEINREYLSKNGIIDDEEIRNDMFELINQFYQDNKANYYVLSSDFKNPIIFKLDNTSSLNLNESINLFFENHHGLLVKSYKLENNTIIFEVHHRQENLEDIMRLKSCNEIFIFREV